MKFSINTVLYVSPFTNAHTNLSDINPAMLKRN
jgi:hypothetical protein